MMNKETKSQESTVKKPRDLVTMMAQERQAVLDAVNRSGLPAAISEHIVEEILQAIRLKAQEEYAEAEANLQNNASSHANT